MADEKKEGEGGGGAKRVREQTSRDIGWVQSSSCLTTLGLSNDNQCHVKPYSSILAVHEIGQNTTTCKVL